MTNKDPTQYTIEVILHIESAHYSHRIRGDIIKTSTTKNIVKASAAATTTLDISWDDYRTKLMTQYMFLISCHAKIVETGYEYGAQKPFKLTMPTIVIEVKIFVLNNSSSEFFI